MLYWYKSTITDAAGAQLSANKGTGVRALGHGSWAVHSDCTIADNGWHGVSALQGGSAFIQKSSLTRNLGAGVNAFSRCSLALLGQQYLLTGLEYKYWCQRLQQVLSCFTWTTVLAYWPRVQVRVSTPSAGVARLHFVYFSTKLLENRAGAPLPSATAISSPTALGCGRRTRPQSTLTTPSCCPTGRLTRPHWAAALSCTSKFKSWWPVSCISRQDWMLVSGMLGSEMARRCSIF